MSYTLVAFSESQDEAGAYTNVAAVTDQHIRTSGDNISVPKDFNKLIGAAAFLGSTGVGARLQSPSLRRTNPYPITPVVLTISSADPAYNAMLEGSSVQLETDEFLTCEVNADPAAAEQHTVLAFLANADIQAVKGSIRTIKATVTLALVAGAWAFSQITIVDNLPVGSYNIVGMRVECAAGVAARLVPTGLSYRPGVICDDGYASDITRPFRYGKMGVLCDFTTTSLPGLEIISSAAAASASYNMYLDVMQK